MLVKSSFMPANITNADNKGKNIPTQFFICLLFPSYSVLNRDLIRIAEKTNDLINIFVCR